MKKNINRREFIGTAAAASAFTLMPRHVLGGPQHTAPSDRINLALVGSGTMGLKMLMSDWLPREDLHVSAVVDPNTASDDYVDWGEYGLRDGIREFLDDPDWAEGVDGILGGREVGRELVQRYYGRRKRSGTYKGVAGYADYRELLEEEDDLDGVLIMTPEHLHATIAIAAMNEGKHAISHKTLSNVLSEVRLAAETAGRNDDVVTHLMAWQNDEAYYRLKHLIESGAVGEVKEVHNWSNRPVWPQGWLHHPIERPPVPEGMDWDLWLGPVPHRPYHPAYTHALFRGWIDFGSGCLGDMGNYSLWRVYRILGLGAPSTVIATPTHGALVVDQVSRPKLTQVAHPHSTTNRFFHPAANGRGPVEVIWYDGGMRPAIPREVLDLGETLPIQGMMIVGSDGFILGDFHGGEARVFSGGRLRDLGGGFEPEKEDADEILGGTEEWVTAVKEGRPSRGRFENVQPLAEATCLGIAANLMDGRVDYDADRMEITSSAEANRLLYRDCRPGWELVTPNPRTTSGATRPGG